MAECYNAKWFYDHVLQQIDKFEKTLDEDSEVGLQFTSFGGKTTMAVDKIGYQDPYLLYFCGKVRGDDAQLIQHMNQLDFLLVAEKKSDPELPPRRLGFECGVGSM